MMPMRLIVLMLKPASFSDPSGRGFARNCLGARIYLGMFFCGCNRNKLQALQFGTQEHASLSTSDPTVSVFQSRNVQTVQEPTITMVRVFDCRPYSSHPSPQLHRARRAVFSKKTQAIISRKTWQFADLVQKELAPCAQKLLGPQQSDWLLQQPLPCAVSSCHRQVLQHMLCETYKLLNEANRSIGYTPASDDDYAEAWASFVASWG